jgi:hypothetical protein
MGVAISDLAAGLAHHGAVKPATVVQWHRKGFRLYWRGRSRSRQVGRPKTSTDIRDLIRRMSMANPIWGAPRIHGELLMLGIEVSQATVGEINAVATQGPLPDLAQLTPCFSVGGCCSQWLFPACSAGSVLLRIRQQSSDRERLQ